VAEAMATGVLCVVTDVGDAAHIVGDTGWIAPPRDARALAQAISQACAAHQSPDREQRSQRARERVERLFSLDTMVQGWHTVWRRLAADFPQPGEDQRPVYSALQAAATSAASVRPAQSPAATKARLLLVVNNPAFFLSHRLSLARAAKEAGYDVH